MALIQSLLARGAYLYSEQTHAPHLGREAGAQAEIEALRMTVVAQALPNQVVAETVGKSARIAATAELTQPVVTVMAETVARTGDRPLMAAEVVAHGVEAPQPLREPLGFGCSLPSKLAR